MRQRLSVFRRRPTDSGHQGHESALWATSLRSTGKRDGTAELLRYRHGSLAGGLDSTPADLGPSELSRIHADVLLLLAWNRAPEIFERDAFSDPAAANS